MNAFKLPLVEGTPSKIEDFTIDLQSSPPRILEGSISTTDKYLLSEKEHNLIIYKDAPLDEGYLNIYLCCFNTGKYILHIFGRINDRDFRTEKVIEADTSNNPLTDKIRNVLTRSKNLLRRLYQETGLTNLEEHLMGLLFTV